jgi:hypothetical protein
LRAAGHTVHTPDLYDGRTFETYEDGSAHSETLGGPMAIVESARAEVDLRSVAKGCNHGAPLRLHASLPSKATSGRRPYGRGDRLVALGGEVATTDLLADEAGELPLQSGVLVPPLVEFVLVGAAPLDAPEFGDAYADAFEQALGPLPVGGRHQAASSSAGMGSGAGSIASRGRRLSPAKQRASTTQAAAASG